MSKLLENTFRAVNIALVNELALICDRLGLNVWEIIGAAATKPFGFMPFWPGPGLGGHCIPIDPWFIHHAAPKLTPLIRTTREVNMAKTHWVTQRVCEKAARFKEPRIALLGLSYKPDIDDFRESPAVEVVELLAQELALSGSDMPIIVVEPHIHALPHHLAGLEKVRLGTLDDGLTADLLVMLVDHRAFRAVPKDKLTDKDIIDTRGAWRGAPAR